MNYTVRLKRSAEKELEDLPDHVHDRIAERLLTLEQNPRPRGVRKLRGRAEEYRLRVGDLSSNPYPMPWSEPALTFNANWAFTVWR